jgi:hypothetical protein
MQAILMVLQGKAEDQQRQYAETYQQHQADA